MKSLREQKLNLKKQLRQFGLNPREWNLFFTFEKADPQIIFHHKEQKTLSLLGRLDFKNAQPKIEDLELLAL